jgi:predicted 3-demethylubiquinone-9 3-methyltransferase (glyoxalase superfamily)
MSALENHSRITPFLWFDKNAEEAVDFYLSVFKNSRRLGELRNNSIDDPRMVPKGGVLTVSFELDGLRFTALNGGPSHQFTDAISFVVRCDSQDEVDYYWSKLTCRRRRSRLRLAQGQVRPLLADRARAPARAHPAPQGHAGHDGHEEARHRRTRGRRPIGGLAWGW